MKKDTISIVIASYKNSESILELHNRLVNILKKIGCRYEIIFVNDGSPDNTKEILKRLVKKDHNVIGVNHTRNFNSQMAFTSGMEIARGDAVVLMDGDLQDPPEVIEKFYKKWKEGYEVVVGIRNKREGSTIFSICAKLFYVIFSMLSHVDIPRDAGDFSLLDKKVVKAINSMPERDRFIRGLRAWVGYKRAEVSYFRPKRAYGKSTNNFLSDIDWALRGIINFSYIPIRMITLSSLFLACLSFVSLIGLVVIKYILHINIESAILVIIFFILLFSVQSLILGIIGEYILRIFEETKNRPHFIIESIIRV